MSYNKKLIEVALPLEAINEASAREKSINIAEICRTSKGPVFLTRNGESDMVIMDIETYGRREEELAAAERLMAVERARLLGTQGYSIEEFQNNMRKAIRKGASA